MSARDFDEWHLPHMRNRPNDANHDDMKAELMKAADTYADTAKYFRLIGKTEGAEAFLIAEQSARAVIAKATGAAS